MMVQSIDRVQPLCTMLVQEPKPPCFGSFVCVFMQTYLCPCLHGQVDADIRVHQASQSPRHFARHSRESVIVGNTLPTEVKRPAEDSKQCGGEKP